MHLPDRHGFEPDSFVLIECNRSGGPPRDL